jgi:hypothetical protein
MGSIYFPIELLSHKDRLKTKKDNTDAITQLLNNTNSLLCFKIDKIIVPIKQIINNPLAKPSNPSVKLTAFVLDT